MLNHCFHFKINWLSFSELLQIRPDLPDYGRIKITNKQIVGLKLFILIITEICMDDSNFWVTGRLIWHTFEGRNFFFMSQNYRKKRLQNFAKNFCNFLNVKTRQNHTNRWFYSKGPILKKCRLSSVLSLPPQTVAPLPVNSQHKAVTDMNRLDLDCTQPLINCLDPGGTWLLITTHIHTQPFYGPLSGTTRVSRYQKKHSPTHHPDHHPIFISFFHLLWSIASSLFKLRAWQSFCTTSLHVLSGLPLGLGPSASYSIHGCL